METLRCKSCSYLNAPGADTCAKCHAPFEETAERIHPGETLRDPDDLTLPPSPLLRAVLQGEPAAATAPRSTPPPPPAITAALDRLSPTVDQAALLRDLAERLQVRKAEPAVRYAGFFLRAGAFLIDGAVLGAFALPLAAAGYGGIHAGSLVLGQPGPVASDETVLTILSAGWLAMAAVYFTVLHRSYGQTIGKWLLGLKVHTLDLREVGTVRCFIRTLGYAVSSTFLGFGFLLVALTPRKRGWHDFLAGTCVVRVTRDQASA